MTQKLQKNKHIEMNQNPKNPQPTIQPNLSLQQLFNHINTHKLSKQIPAQIHEQFGYAQKLKNPKNNINQTFKISKIMNLNDGKKGNKCQMLIKQKLYICYDCQVSSQGWMCEKCFFQAGHSRHCRFVVKQMEEKFWNVYTCACGDYDKVSFKGTCSQHHKISINPSVCHLPGQAIQAIKSYITGCFKMLIVCLQTLNLQSKFQKSEQLNDLQSFLYWVYQRKLFQDLSTSTKKTNQYTCLLQQCLLQQLPLEYFSTPTPNPTILTYLLSKILKLEDRSFTTLIQLLLEYNSKKFIYVLLEDCLLAKGMIRNRKMALLRELKSRSVFRGDVLCEMLLEVWGRHGDGVFDVEDLGFYASATCPNLYLHKQQRKPSYLLPYWSHLQHQNKLTIQKILQIHTTSILSILTNTLASPKLFSSMLIKLIKYTHEKTTAKFITKNETGRSINITQLCNIISKLTLTFVQGDYNQIYTFFQTLAVDEELCFILFYYFGDLVGNTAQISQQAVFTFGMFLGCLAERKPQNYGGYVKMWQGKNIQSEKMIDLMAKISNIIFGQQLKYLAKITTYKQITQQQRSCIQKKQEKKLLQLLHMQKKLPKKQLQVILKQNILNFEKAGQIIQAYTQYDDKSDCFIYNSKEDHSSFDGIFNAIFDLWGIQVDNLVFDSHDDGDWGISQDNFQVRKLVIFGIMKPFLEGDERDIYLLPPSEVKTSYKIVKSEFEYVKFICLITIDKYVDGKIASLRRYLLSKRKQLFKQPIIQNPRNKAQKMISKLQKIFGCLSLNMREDTDKIVENLRIRTNQNSNNKQKKEQNKEQNPKKIEQFPEPSQQQYQITPESKIKVQTQQTKIQPTQIVSPSSQKQISESIQSTPNSKLQKLKQKFKKKQESILNVHIDSNNISPSKQNAQTCMTCKQEGYHDNALFYLGTLKKQGQQCKIFQSAFRTEYSATLCMHLIHQKCFLKMCTGNSINCPLCRTTSNIIFPHQHEHLTPKTLQFFQNRLTYTFISSFQQYHHDKSFLFMLKTVISQALFEIISSILLLRDDAQQGIIKNISTEQNHKKIKYYLELIRKWWNGLEECQRDVQVLKINNRRFGDGRKGGDMGGGVGDMGGEGERNPKVIMDLIVKSVIWNQIDKYDVSKQLHHLLSQLEQLMDTLQFSHFLKKLQQITPNPIKFTPCIQKKGSKKFLDYYMTPPQKLCYLQLNRTCPKCVKQTQTYYCLLCNIIYCNGCNHEKTHDNIYLRIECASGQIQSKGKTVSSNTKIYFNQFHQAWKSVQYGHDDYFAYTLDNLAVGKAVTFWIRNIST